LRLRPVRIALWDRYGGSTTSGWTRWILERYGFPFEVVYPQTLDAGDLARHYDVIILTDDAVFDGSGDGAPPDDRLPAEFRGRTGRLTRSRTVPRLKEFLLDGGTVIAVGRSTEVAQALRVPVSNALVEGGSGTGRPLLSDQYFVPGSVLRMSVDNTMPLGYGFERQVDVFFDNSPVFRLNAGAQASRVARVAWFASANPLRSGWAWGQRYLDKGVTAIDVPIGRGHLALFGPEITFRAQSHGTFKFLFNAIYYGRAETASLPR